MDRDAVVIGAGIEPFRAVVAAWYDGSLQRIIFNQPRSTNRIQEMIISVLARSAWDTDKLVVQNPRRYLAAVEEHV